LAERDINIADISQTIMQGNFVMIMMVDLSRAKKDLETLKAELDTLGGQMGVSVSIMHERVFSAMHRI
jgi:ACT domain-containing protein